MPFFYKKKIKDIINPTKKNYLDGYDFEIGQDVRMRQFSNKGVIVELNPDEKKSLLVSWVYTNDDNNFHKAIPSWEYPHMVIKDEGDEDE